MKFIDYYDIDLFSCMLMNFAEQYDTNHWSVTLTLLLQLLLVRVIIVTNVCLILK